jgi:hypothetical protein
VGCLSPPDTAPAPLLLPLLSPSLLSLPLVTLLLLLRTKPPLLLLLLLMMMTLCINTKHSWL